MVCTLKTHSIQYITDTSSFPQEKLAKQNHLAWYEAGKKRTDGSKTKEKTLINKKATREYRKWSNKRRGRLLNFKGPRGAFKRERRLF